MDSLEVQTKSRVTSAHKRRWHIILIEFAIYDKSYTIAAPRTSSFRTENQGWSGTNLFLNGFLSPICSNFLFRFRSLIKPISKSGFTFESFKNLSSFSLKNLSNSILKFHSKNYFAQKSSFLNSLGVEGGF